MLVGDTRENAEGKMTREQRLENALEEAIGYIKLNGHKTGVWFNDPHCYNIITKVLEPALKK